MASYYYLISSLPDLTTDGDMPITYDEFLGMCESTVSKSKYELLKNLTPSSTEGPLLSEWAKSYGTLTKELNYLRSAEMGKTYKAPEDKEPASSRVAADAMAAKNPLEAEKILLDYQFELLDLLVGMHTFDDEYLFGYAMKLKLLERRSCFDKKKGQDEFKRLFDLVQKRVYTL